MNPIIQSVTNEIIERSHESRSAYLKHVDTYSKKKPQRAGMGCANLAHGFAACSDDEKSDLTAESKANIAIVTSYNDML
jgi:phosphogluconate dehydratase